MSPPASDDFVYVADTAKGWVVRMSDISTLEARGNYVRVTLDHGDGGKLLIRQSLTACEEKLDGRMFFRANRQWLVNLNYVKSVRALDPKRLAFVLSDGREVPLSRHCTLHLKKTMSL